MGAPPEGRTRGVPDVDEKGREPLARRCCPVEPRIKIDGGGLMEGTMRGMGRREWRVAASRNVGEGAMERGVKREGTPAQRRAGDECERRLKITWKAALGGWEITWSRERVGRPRRAAEDGDCKDWGIRLRRGKATVWQNTEAGRVGEDRRG